MISLVAANFVGTMLLETEKPVFVEEGGLSVLGKSGAEARSSSD